MRFWGILVLLFFPVNQLYSRSGLEFERYIEGLYHTEFGKKIIYDAQAYWKLKTKSEIAKHLRWDRVSRTDSVVTRHFDSKTGKEEVERKVTVILNKKQPDYEIILDLAHELTHAIYQPGWDPYDPDLTAGKYIYHAIEGNGGEVLALKNECHVYSELFISGYIKSEIKRCKRYFMENKSKLNEKKVLLDFYHVGEWKEDLLLLLGKEEENFPLLTDQEPLLYSSTGLSPYPVALYYEFEQMNQSACSNALKRLANLKDEKRTAKLSEKKESTLYFIEKRCSRIFALKQD